MNASKYERNVRAAAGTLIAAALIAAGCATSPTFSGYPQNACTPYVHAKKEFKADITWCVRYVEVRDDVMEVRVSWELVRLQGKVDTIFQISDEDNPKMYLTDEFGNRYDHSRVSGAAKGRHYPAGSLQNGSFFFPLPRAGVRMFRFHDDENGVMLPIRL